MKAKLRTIKVALAFMAMLINVTIAQASPVNGSTSAKAETRSIPKIGVGLSIGNPYPSILGLSGSVQITDDLRARVGYGEVEVTSSISFSDEGVSSQSIKAQSYSAGAEYFFLPTKVRGVVGAHLGYFNVSGEGSFSMQGMSETSAFMYSNLGFDWLSSSGFNVGAGFNLAYLGASGAGFYLNSGWFF